MPESCDAIGPRMDRTASRRGRAAQLTVRNSRRVRQKRAVPTASGTATDGLKTTDGDSADGVLGAVVARMHAGGLEGRMDCRMAGQGNEGVQGRAGDGQAEGLEG